MTVRATDASQAYFDHSPALQHETGDIWKGLPTFGLFGNRKCTGVVITPACDLAWSKTPTVTFLPTVSFTEGIASGIFYPELRAAGMTAADTIGCKALKRLFQPRNIPSAQAIAEMKSVLGGLGQLSKRQSQSMERLLVLLNILELSHANLSDAAKLAVDFKCSLGETEWQKLSK